MYHGIDIFVRCYQTQSREMSRACTYALRVTLHGHVRDWPAETVLFKRHEFCCHLG